MDMGLTWTKTQQRRHKFINWGPIAVIPVVSIQSSSSLTRRVFVCIVCSLSHRPVTAS